MTIPAIETRYRMMRWMHLSEALDHIEAGEPERSLHHLVAANMPETAYVVYKKTGGKAKDIRGMLEELRPTFEKNYGIDIIHILYGKRFGLLRK